MGDELPPDPEAPRSPGEAGEGEDEEVAPVIAESSTGQPSEVPPKATRPLLLLSREPLFRESRGYRMRLEPADLARLRELPGSKGLSDQELGEAFFDGQADRFTEALSEDVPAPAEIRVVVDPYSRQAFLALENKIRAILSF